MDLAWPGQNACVVFCNQSINQTHAVDTPQRHSAVGVCGAAVRPKVLLAVAGPTRLGPFESDTEDSSLEEGDDLGATEEEAGEVDEGGAGTAPSDAPTSSAAAVGKRRISNWRKLELVGLPFNCLPQFFIVLFFL